MYLKSITLRTRPAASEVDRVMRLEEKSERDRQMALLVTTFFIQELQIDVGLLAAITGKASIDFDATIGGGSIEGNVTIGKAGTEVAIEGEGLPSQLLPMREAIGLPMSGNVRFAFNLDLPNEKLKTGKVGPNWLKATGDAMFQCPAGCIIGDGKTKLKTKLKKASQQEFVGEGIDFGKVLIQSMLAKVEVKKGKLAITKFEAKSDDGKLEVEYEMALQQNIDDSDVEGCLRFEGSETLRKREAKTHTALTTTGAQRGPDGLFHIRLDGKFKEMKRLPQSCGPGVPKDAATAGGSATEGTSTTPSLKVQPPDEPIRPPGEGTPIPQTPVPAPDAGAADAAVNVPVPGPGSENHTGSGSAGSAAPGSGSAFGSANLLPDAQGGSAAPTSEPVR